LGGTFVNALGLVPLEEMNFFLFFNIIILGKAGQRVEEFLAPFFAHKLQPGVGTLQVGNLLAPGLTSGQAFVHIPIGTLTFWEMKKIEN
jgi:hypothetical protein